jgi:ribonuclease P protein component
MVRHPAAQLLLHMKAGHQISNTFRFAERLKSRKQIGLLLQQGKSHRSEPFSLLFIPVKGRQDQTIQITFTAPKRKLKRAVDRNRAKRLMREAYRLNKHKLEAWCSEKSFSYDLMLIFRGTQLPDFHVTQEKIVLLLSRLMQEPNEKHPR